MQSRSRAALGELALQKRYILLLPKLYSAQVAIVVRDKERQSFHIAMGTKQGDPLPCALFNSVIECVVRRLKASWASKGMGFALGEGRPRRLQDLKFASGFQ